ncbi:MAG: hypothetical protein ABEJ71_01760 [Halodesulfurarchaeum sp.]
MGTLVLALLATVVGLFVPGFYRDAPPLLPQAYGQDLLTLVFAIPALAFSLYYSRKGSLRAYVVWLGVTGYILYTYASYAFMTAFNELYLVYTTLLWLSLYAFVGGFLSLDPEILADHLRRVTRWPYVAFQLLLVFLVGFLWLSEIVPAILTGTVPSSVAEAGLPTSVIYSLDLGIILPAFLISAYWLWRDRPWGYALTAVLLVKVATLGGAVLAMAYFMMQFGQTVPLPMVAIFAFLTVGALILFGRYLWSIRPASPASP